VQPRRARRTSSYGACPDSPPESEQIHGIAAIDRLNPQRKRAVPAPRASSDRSSPSLAVREPDPQRGDSSC